MIAHLDIDAFFAAVEIHRRPELRGRPMVVGGDPQGRGVVATASYAARAFGIRSAMSCAEARRRCPEVVFVRPDIAHYREWSARVWELVREMSPAVEVLGMDEGYLELPDEDACEAADAVRRAVAERVRLSCSLGVATCKVVAKVASDRDKPGGVTVVAPGEEAAFLAPLPLRALPGIGPRTEERLRAAGLATVGDVAALDDDGPARRRVGPQRRGPAPARPRDRPAAGGVGSRRAHLDLLRDDLRPGRPRPGQLERVGREQSADEVRRAAAQPRPGGPHGDGQAALRRLPTVTRGQTVHAATDDEGRDLGHRPRAPDAGAWRARGRPAAHGRRRVGAERRAASSPSSEGSAAMTGPGIASGERVGRAIARRAGGPGGARRRG